MRFIILIFFVATAGVLVSTRADAQIAHDFQVGAGLDLVKTDLFRIGQKLQLGIEGNYFFTRKVTGTVGIEFWTDQQISAVLGARYYPVNFAFIKARGLIGVNELALGGGVVKNFNGNWNVEASADFYFSSPLQVALRAGVVYVFRRQPK